jgi:hypothetical protein
MTRDSSDYRDGFQRVVLVLVSLTFYAWLFGLGLALWRAIR